MLAARRSLLTPLTLYQMQALKGNFLPQCLPLHLQTSFPDILMIDLILREVATFQRQIKPIPRLTRNR